MSRGTRTCQASRPAPLETVGGLHVINVRDIRDVFTAVKRHLPLEAEYRNSSNIIYTSTRNTYSFQTRCIRKRGCCAEKYADTRFFPSPFRSPTGRNGSGWKGAKSENRIFSSLLVLMTPNTLYPSCMRKILTNTCTRRPKQFD